MSKTLMLALSLLLSAASASALEGGAFSSGDDKNPPQPTTIQGCLHYDNGQFSLVDHDGTSHRLAGSGKQLKGHVGHEVELTGKPSSRTIDNTPAGGASSVIQVYVFEVKSVRHVDLNCKTY